MTMLSHILVPMDGSRLAECVLPHTAAVARAFGARVTLLHVLKGSETDEQLSLVDPLSWHINKAQSQAYLDGLTTQLREIGLDVENVILEGNPPERIVEYAHTQNVDLMVLSSHGQSGLSGWNISSVVQKILMRAYISIMIVRAYQPTSDELATHSYQHVLVPLDCSKRAECALPLAIKLAGGKGASLTLAHIVERPEIPCCEALTAEDSLMVEHLIKRNQQVAAAYLDRLRSDYPGQITTYLSVSDSPQLTLHELVEQQAIDLVVLSAHGSTQSVKWPYGSLVIGLIAYGTSPVLIVQDITPNKVQPTLAEIAAREQKGH